MNMKNIKTETTTYRNIHALTYMYKHINQKHYLLSCWWSIKRLCFFLNLLIFLLINMAAVYKSGRTITNVTAMNTRTPNAPITLELARKSEAHVCFRIVDERAFESTVNSCFRCAIRSSIVWFINLQEQHVSLDGTVAVSITNK